MTPPALTPMDVAGRVERLRAALAAHADVFLVTDRTDVRYLSGFTGSAGRLLVTADELVLVTDARYGERAADETGAAGVELRIEIGRMTEQREALRAAVPTGGRLALDAESVTWSDQRGYAGAFEGCELVPTEGLVGGLRVVKDAGEVARMRAAAAIADEALAAVLPRLSAGDTEARVALAFDTTIRELGADGPAFDTIVASGGNGARPHHEPGERAIRRGDLVIIDCGATVDGYRSDMTRTFSIGEPDESAAAMVELVTRAQAAGVAAVAPGRAAVTIDEACRAVIAEAGRGEEFLHGAGHGVGLDIHESPWAVPGSEDDLDEGMVVTVEPGVYRSGLGGVRIEDTVLVTPAGAEPLTWHPKEPFVLPAPA